jgi:short-subunit dehydrogenase
MNVNCFGIYRMTKAFFPLLKEENEKLKAAGEGTCSIVNMTSMAGTSRL